MGYEIEVKAECPDCDAFKKKIIAMGAVFISKDKQEDIYYNHPDRDFNETDEALRLRSNNEQVFLAYKGPKVGTVSMARVEHETGVDDLQTARSIFFSLGFDEFAVVAKTRTVYSLGEVIICIDDVDELGCYVELEKESDEIKQAETELIELGNKLDLKQYTKKSYLELLNNEE